MTKIECKEYISTEFIQIYSESVSEFLILLHAQKGEITGMQESIAITEFREYGQKYHRSNPIYI